MGAGRDAIREALATIPGIVAYDAEPDQKAPGIAWPVLRELNPDGSFCAPYTRTYDVFAVLPAGYGPHSAQVADDLIEPLVDALQKVGDWTPPAEVVRIQLSASETVPGIRVRITPTE